jgi:hypothetical protein
MNHLPTWCSCMRMPCMFEGGLMHDAHPVPEPAKAAEPARTQRDTVIDKKTVVHSTHLPMGRSFEYILRS